MSLDPQDLIDMLKVLTVEQRLSLAESLPIPSWLPGTASTEGLSGAIIEVQLDRDLATATTVQAKNVTGTWIATGTRVLVRKDGSVLEIDGILGGTGLPAGLLLPYGGSTQPSWGVFGQGQTVPNSGQYARLGAALGYTTTTFTVPDVRGRIAISRTAETLLSVAGAMSRTIAQANLPNVDWTVTDPGHFHYDGDDTFGNTTAAGSAHQEPGLGNHKQTANAYTGISVNSGGSGTALDTTPKVVYCNGLFTL